jgi:hypothetical protein
VRNGQIPHQTLIWPKKGSRPSTFVLRSANDYPLRPKSSIEEAFDHDEAGDSDSDFDFLVTKTREN